MPSVRGRERLTVGTALVASGTVTGALVGFVAGLALGALGPITFRSVVGVIVVGVVADGANLFFGRPAPLASGRQVPQEWSRLLAPRVVAVLYGARLGVGPLTMLSTWTWWSVTIAAALVGPVTSVAVGASFGFVRLVVTVAVSAVASADSHVSVFGRLRARRRPSWGAITTAGALLVVAATFGGCSDPAAEPTEAAPRPEPSPLEVVAAGGSAEPPNPVPTARPPDGRYPAAVDPSVVIAPARLEDHVRTAPEETATPSPTEAARGPDVPSAEPEALEAALVDAIAGFDPVEEPGADRYLDLRAAAAIQPDPTEEIALLETRGFEGGWTRAFRNADNDVAVASVYHFADAAEAEFYLEDGLITIGGYGGRFFDIEGLPGVRGFTQTFSDPVSGPGAASVSDPVAPGAVPEPEPLVSLGAAFHAGPRWYLVYLVGSPETVTPDVLVPAVTAQLRAAGIPSETQP